MMADPDGLAASDPSHVDTETRAEPGVLKAYAAIMREAGRHKGRASPFDVVAGARGDRLPLDAVNVPTRLWYGGGDEYITLEHGRWYAERIARSRFEGVDGAGHLCRWSAGGRSFSPWGGNPQRPVLRDGHAA